MVDHSIHHLLELRHREATRSRAGWFGLESTGPVVNGMTPQRAAVAYSGPTPEQVEASPPPQRAAALGWRRQAAVCERV